MPSDEKKKKRTGKKAAPKEETKPAREPSEKIDDAPQPVSADGAAVEPVAADATDEAAAKPAEADTVAAPEVTPVTEEGDGVADEADAAAEAAEAEPEADEGEHTEEDEEIKPEADTDDLAEDSTDSPALACESTEEAAPEGDGGATDETVDEGETEDGGEADPTEKSTDTDEAEPTDDFAVADTHAKSEETVHPHAVGHAPAHEKKKDGPRRIDAIFDFIELFVFTLAAVLFISAFFLRHSVVDGDSMLGTLHDGENLLISDFLYEPERGDIIVVDDHSTLLKKPIIKRVIALGGDTVRITRTGVYVNGELLEEEYVFTDSAGYLYDIYPSAALMTNDTLVVKAGEYYELTVPEGELFIMGDHRNKSTDSREIGTVDEDAVLGRVILRFYPMNKFGTVE